MLGYNPDVRSACLYGQVSLDKTLTLQAGATVLHLKYVIEMTSKDIRQEWFNMMLRNLWVFFLVLNNAAGSN